jgi:hypothetical protein
MCLGPGIHKHRYEIIYCGHSIFIIKEDFLIINI